MRHCEQPLRPHSGPGSASLRVLFAVNMPFPEGRANTRRLRTIAQTLACLGHEVTVLLPFARTPQPKVSLVDGYRVERSLVPSTSSTFLHENGRVRLAVQVNAHSVAGDHGGLRAGLYDWLYLYQPGMMVSLPRL